MGCASPAGPAIDEGLFERPLIVGASVSGDTGTFSPGKRLGLRFSRSRDIRTIAKGGAPGRQVVKQVTDAEVKGRTIIFAVDFLFWDSTIGDAAPSIEALDVLIARAKAHGVPLVIGNIPSLLSGSQPSRDALNKAIEERCRAADKCTVARLDELYGQVQKAGYLEIQGRRYTLREILPDGLHLSPAASGEIAERILHQLSPS